MRPRKLSTLGADADGCTSLPFDLVSLDAGLLSPRRRTAEKKTRRVPVGTATSKADSVAICTSSPADSNCGCNAHVPVSASPPGHCRIRSCAPEAAKARVMPLLLLSAEILKLLDEALRHALPIRISGRPPARVCKYASTVRDARTKSTPCPKG